MTALGAGCGEHAGKDVVLTEITAVAPSLPPPAGFVPRTDCTAMGAYVGPVAGSRYVYLRADGTRSARDILSVRNGRVEFSYRDLSRPDQEPLPPRQAIAGMLVTYPESGSPRHLRYEIEPFAELVQLRPGATVRIPTVETSTLQGVQRRVEFPTTITYRMCGDLFVRGERMPVRVYSVASARRVTGRQSDDQVRESVVTYFLSARTGYPLAIQDQATTVADAILNDPTLLRSHVSS